MKKICILGSTGSIGESTLKVIRHLGPEKVKVAALAARENIELLEKQAREFQPELIAVYDKRKAAELQKRLPGFRILAGMEGLEEAASHASVNFVISAISGMIALMPTIAAIKAGKDIGLANKESLVSGGSIVMPLAAQMGVSLLPIDSEHSAIFQCLHGSPQKKISRLILTASGGPFKNLTQDELKKITVDHALRHPTWNMGPKITIDCSTLMNKGLEVIEAFWLFNLPAEKIEVVVHPQSIIHSMVEFMDGSILAQMSEPSMIVPIQYAITHPEREQGLLKPFDFTKNSLLQFFSPDTNRFSCLKLAYAAIRTGRSLPCYMNAANEILVQRFIDRQISWLCIAQKLERLMESHSASEIRCLDDVLHVDNMAREHAIRI